jgi:hypothetical protein
MSDSFMPGTVTMSYQALDLLRELFRTRAEQKLFDAANRGLERYFETKPWRKIFDLYSLGRVDMRDFIQAMPL